VTRRTTLLAAAALLAGCPSDPAAPDAGLDASAEVGDAGADAALPDAPLVCTVDVEPEAPLPDPARYTPPWAFEPWISKDISDRADSLAFVAGFRERDIPVGVLVLDSPWDTNYTEFRPNPSRYPDFTEMVGALHADGVRVVLWTTQMTNRRSFDLERGGDVYEGPARTYTEGLGCGFFVENGAVTMWWKGFGAGVDFFDPRARAWWHAQQDYLLLEAGIDGWKLDFGESYLDAEAEGGPVLTDEGMTPFQRYSEEYYRDYLAYGVSRRGRDFITMVRPWDVSYDRRGRFHARPEHAPVAWVGDNHRDWEGIVDALDHIHRSALAGYVVVGADLRGYLDRDENDLLREIPFDLEVFQRWTALAAMTPFMQLHGRGNLAPWTVPGTPEEQAETVRVYRYWSWLHHAMVPYWYSITQEAYAASAGGELQAILHPTGDATDLGDYSYEIGRELFVTPAISPGGPDAVVLPDTAARYHDWWSPAAAPNAAGATIADPDLSDRLRIPLFVADGAILPLRVENDVNGLGSAASAGRLTLLVWPAATESSFRLHEAVEDAPDAITTLTAVREAGGDRVTLSPPRGALVLRVDVDAAPTAVTAGGRALSEAASADALDGMAEGWRHDAATGFVWVRVDAPADAVVLSR
jgi:alpha-glucosidase (family GH31 glycosyl hydrolase)